MPPRPATRRTSVRRKKPSANAQAAADETETTAVDNQELPTQGDKMEADLIDATVVKVEEEKKETEQLVKVEPSSPNPDVKGEEDEEPVQLVQEEVSVPNPVEVDDDSTASVVMVEDKVVSVSVDVAVKEEVVVENCVVDRVNAITNENGEADATADKEEEDLQQGSDNVDEGQEVAKNEDVVVPVEGSLEIATTTTTTRTTLLSQATEVTEVVNSEVLYDNDMPLAVKDDGDEEGNRTAETILAQESAQADDTTALGDNDTALVIKDGVIMEEKSEAEIVSVQESAQDDSTKAPSENNIVVAVKEDVKEIEDDEESDKDIEGDNEGDEDPSLFFHDTLADKKKEKDIEIYVGRLDKGTVEDDLTKVFQQFGELKSIRIVRNPTTKKSKGFAFVRFVSVEQAKHALSELKDGVEVRGKHVKISASQDNDTIYLGNICKTWRKEDVLQQLKHYGIEHLEEITLPDDPKIDGNIKGFALLEFSTHSDAMAAFQRLRKRDAVFGRDISAKVAFTQNHMHPSDEVLSQVKRVYVEGLTKDWNQEKVKEICKQYGEILKISLFQSAGIKHKDFGFVTFTSHESALACVEGINSAGIGGDVKIKASIAKPQHKGRLQKQGFRGGFKVEKPSEVPPLRKEGESSKEVKSSKMKSNKNSQQAKRKREASSSTQKAVALPESKRGGQNNLKKSKKQDSEGQSSKSTPQAENRKRKKVPVQNKKPSKKQKVNNQGMERNKSRNPKKDTRNRKSRDNYRNSTRYADQHAPVYHSSGAYYQAPPLVSTSTRRYTEMEPHAGYIEPASDRQGRSYSGYNQPAIRNHSQHQAVYLEPLAGSQSQLPPRYVDRAVVMQPHRGYIETPVAAQVQPYANYYQPATVQIAQDPYRTTIARTVRRDDRESRGPTYVAASQVPSHHTSYAGHQGGGSYYQRSGAYGAQRRYY